MIVKDPENCEEIVANDNSLLKELLNPRKEDLAISYSLAIARVEPGNSTYQHKLRSSEVYYIISGEGEMHINDEVEKVHKGETIYIPPNAVQWIKNTGGSDLVFLCIVDPAWRAEDEEVIE